MLILSVVPALIPRHKNRGANRDQQNRHDDDKRNVIRERKDLGQNHFHSHKNENDRQADTKVDKPVHQIRQQKIEGAQAKDRADVRGINNEGVLRDGENGWNGIDREDEIHHVDHKQNQG